MKEIKKEDVLIYNSLRTDALAVLNVFRQEPIESVNYPVLIFFLSLHNDGLLSKIKSGDDNNLKIQLREILKDYKGQNAWPYLTLFNFYNPLISSISDRGFAAMLDKILEINPGIIQKYFGNLFEDLWYTFSKKNGRRISDGEKLPKELAEFMSELVDTPNNATVYNPFAGAASLAIYLKGDATYFGQELNAITIAWGNIRLIVQERIEKTNLLLGDSINEWNPNQKFDLIISSPPFRLRLPQDSIDGMFGPIRTVESFVIEKGLESLKDNGKIVLCLAQGFLSGRSNSEMRIKQYLIDNDLLDTVVSFPSGLLYNTGVAVAVIVISKNKSKKGVVKFIDATKYVDGSYKTEVKLNTYGLNSMISKSIESDSFKIVSNNQIKDYEFNLNVPRYFQKQYDGIKLSELGTIIHGQRIENEVEGKFIRIRDLKNDEYDFDLNINEVEKVELPRTVKKIDESCILLAVHWKNLKPTNFNYSGTPIYLTPDVVAFKADEEKVDINYLINELKSDYIIEQIAAVSTGDIVTKISRQDLLNLKINSLSIEEQKAKVLGLNEVAAKIKALEKEKEALIQGKSIIEYEKSSSVKHSLGKPLLNIGSSLRNIEKALSKIDSNWKEIKLSERLDVTMKDSFDSIYSNLELVHSLLKNIEKEIDFASYKLEDVNILKYIKDYVHKIKSSEKANIEVSLDIHKDLTSFFNRVFGNKIIIKAHPELLDIILNNIVENANMHGFTDQTKKHKLEFRLALQIVRTRNTKDPKQKEIEQSFIKIEVANNGEAFPENFSLEKFVRKGVYAGKTGHTGIGGYDINEIIKLFNSGKSTLDLITADHSTEFGTTYTFLIPFDTGVKGSFEYTIGGL